MGCYVEQVIAIARAEVGYLEKASNSNLDSKTANVGDNNYTKYARDMDKVTGFYNGKKQGFAWCDVFVDWCFYKAYGVDNAKRLLCQPDKSAGAGCTYSMRYYKNKGQLKTSPAIGDQIFFHDSGKTGHIAHTGLVIGFDKTYVYTVEGNTSSSSGVVANGGCVREKKYKLSYDRIAGYGRPKYDVDGQAEVSTPTVGTSSTIKVGNVVEFTGVKHYSNANATSYNSCKPGKAKVTAIKTGTKHPFHLVRVSGGGSTVYGWVDISDVVGDIIVSDTYDDAGSYQCIHTVVSGDSLWKLAIKYLGGGSNYKLIMTANGKTSTTLRVGEKLKIPKK